MIEEDDEYNPAMAGLLGRMADMLDPTPKRDEPFYPSLAPFFMDPVGFVEKFIDWKGEEIAPYQKEILSAIPVHNRVSARGPHGLGKTTTMALAVIWFSLTREGLDWKIVTTASTWRQLTKYLWPEIHKWVRRLDWELIGRPPFDNRKELFRIHIRLETGEAFAVASDTPENIEGAHADYLMYIVDESKTVIAGTFDAIEGAFSGAGADTTHEAFALAFSTPGEPAGRFYDIHVRRPGFEDWWVRHVTLQESIDAGRNSQEWADQRARQWGITSSVYRNRVLGEFAKDAVDGLIPLAWVEAAMERWPAARDHVIDNKIKLSALGVDVARAGHDKTIYAPRFGKFVDTLEEDWGADTMEVSGHSIQIVMRNGREGYIAVDVIGIGAGVVDRLREQGYDVWAFNGSEKAEQTDLSGELEFTNTRAAAWWTLREILDPINGFDLALPPDDELMGDLMAPRYKRTSGGRIQIEDKEQIKKRLGRSPDRGDAVAMACALRPEEITEGYAFYEDMVQISAF